MTSTFKQFVRIFSLVSFFSLVFVVSASWAPPTQAPPGGNAEPPLNTSIYAQFKRGGLVVNAGPSPSPIGFVVPNGTVGIGTANPLYRLDVQGGDVNVSGVYRQGGVNVGMTRNCGTGQTLADIEVHGGIVTDGNCVGIGAGGPSGGDPFKWIKSGTNLYATSSITRVGINTVTPRGALHVQGNAGTLILEGTDSSFVGFYADGFSAGRTGWIGWGSAAATNLSIVNEMTNGDITLTPNGTGRVTTNANINTNGVFSKSGLLGVARNCAPGQTLGDIKVDGGIVTEGGCVNIGGGVTSIIAGPGITINQATGDVIVNGDFDAPEPGNAQRIVSGIVNELGNAVSGNGFSSGREATTGLYRINFVPDFAARPTVVATCAFVPGSSSCHAMGYQNYNGGDYVILEALNDSGGRKWASFSFVAIGPR